MSIAKAQSRNLLALLLLTLVGKASAEPITIYTERKPFLIEPLLQEYTRQTGQEVQILSDSATVLIERLKAEGSYSKADILMTVDAGSLWLGSQAKLFQPLASKILQQNIPANLRDSKNEWFGLSLRARTMVINPKLIDAGLVRNYADLAQPALKGKLCLRSSQKIYNQSLTAMLIARDGEAATEKLIRGWVANLAQAPFADDTLLIQAIAKGDCAVGIANTYYLGRLQKENPALGVQLLWADQAGKGVHMNISGAGVLAASNQSKAAIQLLEWLSTESAQKKFAEVNLEYPVNAKAGLDPVVAQWGRFKQDQQPMTNAGKLQAKAVRLMDRAGWK
jgi:iron(III) transport system substrate-binding protein